MTKQHIHQEVFISTTTTFVQKILHETSDCNRNKFADKLEDAFWNGLLNGMFSELIPVTSVKHDKIYIWGIYTGESYLLVNRADIPQTIELVFSIDPRLFLPELNLN